ncbi:MAG: hypothetical protein MJ103_07560 [Saccharofermentans sp.]|nr:hypothetical protein [Saccharofermentans sp.]
MRHELFYERDELFDVNMVITISIDVEGTVTEDEAESAFRNAIAANEILNTKIVLDSNGNAFYEENLTPRSSLYKADGDLDVIRINEERRRFKVEEGEYIRAFVKENDAGASILFLMHHLGGDGKSLLYFIEDFMRFLSGAECDFKIMRRTENRAKLDAVSSAVAEYYNKRWCGKIFTFDDLDKSFESYWSRRISTIETEVIDEDEMAFIMTKCHEAGVKFTAFLTARLISDRKGIMDIGYAVDYRHDKNRSMGNQVSGISIKYRYNSAKSLMENARRIQRKLDSKLQAHSKGSYVLSFVSRLNPTLRDAVSMEHSGYFHDKVSYRLAKLMGYVGKIKDYSITNLKVADIPVRYGRYEIKQMMFAGPVVSYGQNLISVVTCNGKTVISRHTRKEIK